jgi:hypothetical protein
MNFCLVNKRTLIFGCLVFLLAAPVALSQDTAPAPAKSLAARRLQAAPAPTISVGTPALNDKDVADTQRKLIELLRLSPTLTTVIARDPREPFSPPSHGARACSWRTADGLVSSSCRARFTPN